MLIEKWNDNKYDLRPKIICHIIDDKIKINKTYILQALQYKVLYVNNKLIDFDEIVSDWITYYNEHQKLK
jgi:hypothetical protein